MAISKLNTVFAKHHRIIFGIFSVIRIERPAQLLVTATDYSVPDKECVAPDEDDPCRLFHTMAFPVNEFCPPEYVNSHKNGGEKHCSCRHASMRLR